MKRFAIGLSVLCLATGLVWAGDRNLAFQIGQKGLDNDDWGTIDSQLAFGLHYDMAMGWPVNLSGDVLMSSGSDGDLSGGTTELTVGVRKYFNADAKPAFYAGAGLSFVLANSKIDGTTWDESANGIGFTANGGALYPINEKFNIGLDLRFTSANADFNGTDVASGGLTYSLVVGMGL